jgi:hypothetical protein
MQSHERYVGRLLPNMDVCDAKGQKIGTVARVYRDEFALALSATGGPAESTPDRPPHVDVVEVKTGLLGLGEHLFIPVDVIRDATPACIFLATKKDELAEEWHQKPDYLAELQ